MVVRPADVFCTFEAEPPIPLETQAHSVNGEMCLPLGTWLAIGIRDARWRRVYEEVLACKVMQEAVRAETPPATP